jgi:tetratricopeptide (TPR) repeat protein
MQSFKVRNVCLPYGPEIDDFFGPQRVYGYGGDSPGIQTRLEQELVNMGEDIARPAPVEPTPLLAAVTNTPGSDWIQKGQFEFQKGNYQAALECYQKAVAVGASAKACPGLTTALLEVALDENPDQPQAEIETLRRRLGFPPVEASWVDWFAAGRKYQAGKQSDYQKAAACYRGALNFLEHPEQMGVYHLEKQPNSDRVALRWGPSLGEVDLLWSENYDRRWYSAAFYMAQCLIKLDKKEEAAQWLRRIALQIGGDRALPLLERDAWKSSGWSSGNLGVRASEMLKELHQDAGSP